MESFPDVRGFFFKFTVFVVQSFCWAFGVVFQNISQNRTPHRPSIHKAEKLLPVLESLEIKEVLTLLELLGKENTVASFFCCGIPSRGWIHIPPWEKENHLQNTIFGGYVSSLEDILFWIYAECFFLRLWRDCEELGTWAIREHLSTICRFICWCIDVPSTTEICQTLEFQAPSFYAKGRVSETFQVPVFPPPFVGSVKSKEHQCRLCGATLQWSLRLCTLEGWPLDRWVQVLKKTLKWNVNGFVPVGIWEICCFVSRVLANGGRCIRRIHIL